MMKTNNHLHESYDLKVNENQQLKKLKISAKITMILGILSAISVLLTYLALCDIANHEPDQTLEWYMVGVGLLIISIFIISTFVTIRFIFRYVNQ